MSFEDFLMNFDFVWVCHLEPDTVSEEIATENVCTMLCIVVYEWWFWIVAAVLTFDWAPVPVKREDGGYSSPAEVALASCCLVHHLSFIMLLHDMTCELINDDDDDEASVVGWTNTGLSGLR